MTTARYMPPVIVKAVENMSDKHDQSMIPRYSNASVLLDSTETVSRTQIFGEDVGFDVDVVLLEQLNEAISQNLAPTTANQSRNQVQAVNETDAEQSFCALFSWFATVSPILAVFPLFDFSGLRTVSLKPEPLYAARYEPNSIQKG